LCEIYAVDFAARDFSGRTGLHISAEQGHIAISHFLVQRSNVEIDAVDSDGKTPLFYAAHYERAALAKRLLGQYGASPNQGCHYITL
jgi:ankyrin repeat protein